MTIEADYSTYPLHELFKARYWVDPSRGAPLEAEIQKRCARILERAGRRKPPAVEPKRFRPYGLILGAAALVISVGPFAAARFLDAIHLIADASGDVLGLCGVWALLTLPLAVMAFLIGGMIDAERVTRWFNLAGRRERS